MVDSIVLQKDQHRMLVAIRYLNASQSILTGLQMMRGVNDYFFLVSLRSFIEYTRRGIWFLVWATDEEVAKAEKVQFSDQISPGLEKLDMLLHEALGHTGPSPLQAVVPAVGQSILRCFHALCHGNPFAVRFSAIGIENIFDTNGLLAKAELDFGVFRILAYRRRLGENLDSIWKLLIPIQDRPFDMRSNELIAAAKLKEAGMTDYEAFTKI